MKRKKSPTENTISSFSNIILSVILGICALMCVYPVLLLIGVSFTDEKSLTMAGYNIIPSKFSLEGYKYVLNDSTQLLSSYGTSLTVTIIGTLLSLIVVALLAYPLSRQYFKHRNAISFFVFFTMLFNGGLVPSYIINSHYLHLTNTILALILPSMVSAFNVILLRTYFSMNIPDSLIESAKIDGAGEWLTFIKIILPISGPGLATIGLFSTIGYWNDWFNALLYINNNKIVPLQLLLMRIENSIEFLQSNTSVANGQAQLVNLPSETARMAIVVLAIGPIVLAYPYFQKYFVKGMTMGAVKG